MKSWVVTGGVGTGKSSFCKMLANFAGAKMATFSCDEFSRQLLNEKGISTKVIQVLGHEIVDPATAAIDRQRLRDLVFLSDEKRRELEAILHPGVLSEIERQRLEVESAGVAKVFVAEVPLYYEIGMSVKADMAIVVAATEAVQRRRLMEHRQLDEPTIGRMLDAQLPMAEKTGRADVVVWNDGSPAMLEAQAFGLLAEKL
jgi:dephospho-CoA kinase